MEVVLYDIYKQNMFLQQWLRQWFCDRSIYDFLWSGTIKLIWPQSGNTPQSPERDHYVRHDGSSIVDVRNELYRAPRRVPVPRPFWVAGSRHWHAWWWHVTRELSTLQVVYTGAVIGGKYVHYREARNFPSPLGDVSHCFPVMLHYEMM